MAKIIYVNIDEDVTRAGRKLNREPSTDVVLVFPKQSLIFADQANLTELKEHADEAGKHVTVVTADQKGQLFARNAGFDLGDISMLRTRGASMDTVHRHVPQRPVKVHIAPVEPKPPVRQTPVRQAPPHEETFARHTFEPLPDVTEDSDEKQSRSWAGYFIGAAVLGGILLAVLAIVVLPQASLVVYLRTQTISRDITVAVSKDAPQFDSQNLTLPGQLTSSDQTQTVQFNASGKQNVGTQATGTVQIYNFTKKTLKFDAATTTLTVGTSVYHLVSNISGITPTKMIPGTTNVDTASLTAPVQVIADQPGDTYNLPALTRFEIHNQVLGTIPQQLYAQNPDPVQGGISRFRTIVSQQDIDTAGKQLQQAVEDAAKQQALTDKGLTLIDSGANVQVKSVTFDHTVNQAGESFSGTITAHVTGLAFNQDQLKALIEQRINTTLDQNTYLVTDQKEDITGQFNTVDLASGTGSMAVHFASLVAAKKDTKAISAEIIGKSPEQVKEVLLQDPDVDSVSITLKPFWVKSVPRWSGKVDVGVKLDLPASS